MGPASRRDVEACALMRVPEIQRALVTEPFEPLPRPVQCEVEDEAARLAAFLAD